MILVTGATGYTGRFVVSRLLEKGYRLRLLVRAESDTSQIVNSGDSIEIRIGDLGSVESLRLACEGVESVVNVASIRFASSFVQALRKCDIKHLIAISSLRLFSKVPSVTVNAVKVSEETLISSGLPVTILRPSMIFGPGGDHNISKLVTLLLRRGWLPVIGSGCHLHQPVYVEDVADAIVSSIDRESIVCGRQYAIAGPEPLSYLELIDQLGEVIGVCPRRIHVPATLATIILKFMENFGMRLPVTSEQILRLQEDKVYDIGPARNDLGYDPLTFLDALQIIHCSVSHKEIA